jgi:uncharacterized protein (DUF983 family)
MSVGDRYFFKCPVCGEENLFGNWTNYVERCFCGQWLTVTFGVAAITEETAKKMMKHD